MKRAVPVAVLVLALAFPGCSTAPAPAPATAPAPAPNAMREAVPPADDLNAILWQETAAEHHALCLQAYRLAKAKLDQALKDPSWTAAVEQTVEQTGGFASLPPAVILDVDETVLDHGLYGGQNIHEGKGHTLERWTAWLDSGLATALPGAVDFTQYAASKGVEVFFVSNTEADAKPLVKKILVARGFPVKADTLLFKGEQPDWTGNKTSRRAFLARKYRIVMLVGDDLGDFLGGVDTTVEKRQEMADARGAWWGERWILLPNPAYGSWERALTRGGTTPQQRRELKLKNLRGWK